jgi:hypothetical protein
MRGLLSRASQTTQVVGQRRVVSEAVGDVQLASRANAGLDQDHLFEVPGENEHFPLQRDHPHGLAGDDPLDDGKEAA